MEYEMRDAVRIGLMTYDLFSFFFPVFFLEWFEWMDLLLFFFLTDDLWMDGWIGIGIGVIVFSRIGLIGNR